MKVRHMVLFCFMISCLFPAVSMGQDLSSLYSDVEQLNIQRNGYTLGKVLNDAQLKIAADHPVEAASEKTFKFQDKNLFVVALKSTNRVVVIYERFEESDQKKIQNLVGELYLTYEDPTVLAHDKVVYWAYTKAGKVTADQFDFAKEKKTPLKILATVKFVSDIKIMEKQDGSQTGLAYYIISSDPILKQVEPSKT